MKYILVAVFSLIISLTSCNSQVVDEEIANDFKRIFNLLESEEFAGATGPGELLIDSAYVGKTLEKEGEERLVLNLCEFDCLTFVEHFVVLSAIRKKDDFTIKYFKSQLQELRYRNGKIDGYTSRLHYFSDWIYNGVQNDIFTDITCDLGGQTTQFNLNFMSTHPQYYKQLKEDSNLVADIKIAETSINTRSYCVIDQNQIERIEPKLQPGDVIGFVTNVKGLDDAHNGIAYLKNGRIHLMHASSDYKKVMITDVPLSDYVKDMSHMTGISVLRLK